MRKAAWFQSLRLLMLVAIPLAALAADKDLYAKKEFRAPGGGHLRYRLHAPPPGSAKYPLVIWLHDILGIGNDNRRQISGTNADGALAWAGEDIQSRHPSFVVAPQCPIGSLWANPVTRKPSAALRLVPELIDDLVRNYAIDPDRVYLVGQSMGAFGVWALLEAYPDRFAAAAPVSGAGDTRKAQSIAAIPVWIFHARRDPLVPVLESRAMVAALEAAGGHPRYTEYPKLSHTRKLWKTVFHNPELPEWMFAQSRQRR